MKQKKIIQKWEKAEKSEPSSASSPWQQHKRGSSNIHTSLYDLATWGMHRSTLTSAEGGGWRADVRASSVHIPSYGDTWGFVMVRGSQTVVRGSGHTCVRNSSPLQYTNIISYFPSPFLPLISSSPPTQPPRHSRKPSTLTPTSIPTSPTPLHPSLTFFLSPLATFLLFLFYFLSLFLPLFAHGRRPMSLCLPSLRLRGTRWLRRGSLASWSTSTERR